MLTVAAKHTKRRGFAEVRALDLVTGNYAAAQTVQGRSGYLLRVPAGAYAVLASVLPAGAGNPVEALGPAVSLQDGQRRKSIRLPLKKRAKRRPAVNAAVADAGNADVAIAGTLTSLPDGSLGYEVRVVDTRTGQVVDTLQGTLSGDLFAGEQALAVQLAERLCALASYEVTLDARVEGRFLVYDASATLRSTIVASPVDRPTTRWNGGVQAAFSGVSFTPAALNPCSYGAIVNPPGVWTAEITRVGADRISVSWLPPAGQIVTATAFCPTDAGGVIAIPGQPGPQLIAPTPAVFELPVSGGTQALGGGFSDAGVGWTVRGSITVVRRGPGKP